VKATSDGERKIADLLTFAAVRELANLQVSVSERLAVPLAPRRGEAPRLLPESGRLPLLRSPVRRGHRTDPAAMVRRRWRDRVGTSRVARP
jgi:hypothetical protein